ncbi:prenyltransferase alpha subunit [Plasmodium gonderi]|uniref:Protein farnesyltransferase/geranylgeranyltransferase type-1 subunit alpha n=1 Tax=Plasmodium gonderi TaxID=77519 RepID=A0A1Y1JMV1_PLAGO|nr:prenyltransferase alpha subunit [Plasmodium gonderi]GAW83791.1 prenyltransferase alpha subunit [Plasmodium gonderi]
MEREQQAYAMKFQVNYPEQLDGFNVKVLLNTPLFKTASKNNLHIDMIALEKEREKYYLFDLKNEKKIKNKEKINILNTYYTENEKLVYSLLASFIESKIYSFEGYIVSSVAIKINPSYYSAWIYRRKCLRKLNLNFRNDLRFTRFIINDNIKSFQSWFHRRWLVEYIYKMTRRERRRKDQEDAQGGGACAENCHHCVSAENCHHCVSAENCHHCVSAENCHHCVSAENCHHCVSAENCHHCVSAENCHHCGSAENCHHCGSAENCHHCGSAENCHHCVSAEKHRQKCNGKRDKINVDNYDFLEDDDNFISSESSDNDGPSDFGLVSPNGDSRRRAIPTSAESVKRTNGHDEEAALNSEEDAFISNYDETDLEIKKEDVVILHETLCNIVESCNFFKNALNPDDKEINIDEFLYEEMLCSNCDIFLDAKNYNSWAHKTWLIDKLKVFKNKYLCEKYNIIAHEFNFINCFLKHDIYNNSVWVYRYFIFTKLKYISKIVKLEKEIKFCLNYAKQFCHNETIFRYFIHIVFKYIDLHKKKKNPPIKDIFEIPIILNLKNELDKLKTNSKYVSLFLSELYSSNGLLSVQVQCYRYLEKYDDFNDTVWRSKIEEVQKHIDM